MNKRKNGRMAGICLACAMALAFVLTGCGGDGARERRGLTADAFYGIGSVTTAKLLGGSVSARAMRYFSHAAAASEEAANAPVEEGATGEEVAKAQAEDFHKYFAALDEFLGDRPVKVQKEANTDAAYAAYAVKLTIEGLDAAGKTSRYTMYYNETLARAEYDEEDDEQESVYVLDGVLAIGDAVYRMAGERSEEIEADEYEDELKLRAYPYDETDTYIEMEQETSQEQGEQEIEYVYRLYAGGVLVEETAVEFETESELSKNETELTIEFRKGNARGKYSVEKMQKGAETVLTVRYAIDGKRGKFEAEELVAPDGTKTYRYTFSDRTTREFGAQTY